MPDKITPGVIFTSKYVLSDKKFSEYINYIDRPEAIRNLNFPKFSAYTDYMDDKRKQKLEFNPLSEKTSALFTATKDRLTSEEKIILKQQFTKAQKNDSPMWQQVISFTDEFLEQHGLFDRRTGILDENKMREVTRIAMQEMLKDEKMDGAAVWSASIHYNTDNIHIHVAIVEPCPTRKRKEFTTKDKDGNTIRMEQFKGNMNKKTFGKVKSKIVNNIVDRSVELTKINDIIRNNIVAEKRSMLSYRDDKLRFAFFNIYRQLPKDKRLWNYNMNVLNHVRPEIDNFTKIYIDMYHKKDFTELTRELQDQQEFLKTVYGAGKHQYYENYAKTKIRDLYTRMGNAVLHELREYDKAVHPKGKRVRTDKKEHAAVRKSSAIYSLKKALKKDYNQARNQAEFRELQQNIEIEQENER